MSRDTAILAIDTATGGCSAAILVDGDIAAVRRMQMRRGHSEHLAGMIRDVLAEAAISPDKLSAIAASRGPGAFTGLRIGLATARAAALACGCPAIGLTTFAVVAEGARRTAGEALPVLAAIDSRRAEPYACVIGGDGTEASPAIAADAATIGAILPAGRYILAGDAIDAVSALTGDHPPAHRIDMLPDAVDAARLAGRMLASGNPLPPAEPLYIRPPDAVTEAEAARRRAERQSGQ
jgi:tRNA threonylcarbamoyladenosine biosynthesis protein TsaB